MSREKSDSSSGGLQLQTLLISAVSAVAAATIVPLFWVKGTVIATAMTPVIVALSAEALRRPVQKVSAVAPKVSAVRQRVAVPVRGRPHGPIDDDPHDFDPVVDERAAEPVGLSAEDPFGLRAPQRRPWWKIGLATGLLAFVLAAAVVTASELAIFGGSVGGGHRATTFFGGTTSTKPSTPKSNAKQATPSATPSSKASPTATPTPAATATPQATATPTATATPSATPATAAPTATPTP